MPKSILQQDVWHEALAKLVDELATEDFYSCFASACELVSGYHSTMVVWLNRSSRPILMAHDLPEDQAQATIDQYLAGAYLVDPFHGLFENRSPDGLYRLKDIAPDNFLRLSTTEATTPIPS